MCRPKKAIQIYRIKIIVLTEGFKASLESFRFFISSYFNCFFDGASALA